MKLKLLYSITFILLFLPTSFLLAQNLSIYGSVYDKDNGKPIKDVNIYLANTQIGTSSNKNGYFEIGNLPQGTFTIVLSHVSYYFVKREIKLIHKFNDLGTIGLLLKAYELETVLVSDDENDIWEDQFETFRDNFIGEGENSDSTIILNPYKIDFWEDDNKLFASSTEPIEIRNNSLGYKIKYFLDYFETTNNLTKYSGNAVFIPITPNSKSDSARWAKNRIEVYKGSLRHFLGTLNMGYSLFSGIPSKSDSLLNANDFIIYYVKNVPWEVQHPFGEIPISTHNLVSNSNIVSERYLKFSDYLRIYYIPNFNDYKYLLNSETNYIPGIEGSYLKLQQDSVMIDIHGRYYDKFGIHTFGKFGEERISDMLPYEYKYNPIKN